MARPKGTKKAPPMREWHVQSCLVPGGEGCTAHRVEKKVVKGRTYVEVWHCDRCIAREMCASRG